jgi:hypothetical protein
MDVIKSNPDAPADPGDVVVLPLAVWERLVELIDSIWTADEIDLFTCENEIDAIIKKVQP